MHSFDDICQQAGMHTALWTHQARQLELALSVPEQANTDYFAILGHPHPLMEGTMNNKVVTTAGRALLSLNIPVLRFNFRGVGQSTGSFDHGQGEALDMLFLVQEWQRAYPQAKIIMIGFSFGSYVAFRAAQICLPAVLILIAPPVSRFDYSCVGAKKLPDVIFQGDLDEVVAADEVAQFAKEADIPVHWFKASGHFFHGRLIEVREAIVLWIEKCLPMISN